MGNGESIEDEDGFYRPAPLVEKLRALSRGSSALPAPSIVHEEDFQDWQQHANIRATFNLLIGTEDFTDLTPKLSPTLLAIALTAFFELFSNPVKRKKRVDTRAVSDREWQKMFYSIIDHFLKRFMARCSSSPASSNSTPRLNSSNNSLSNSAANPSNANNSNGIIAADIVIQAITAPSSTLSNFDPFPVNQLSAMTQAEYDTAVTVGGFFLRTLWQYLRADDRQALKEKIFEKELLFPFRFPHVLSDIDPKRDSHLYALVRETALRQRSQPSAWTALASFDKVEDHAVILRMLTLGLSRDAIDASKPREANSSSPEEEVKLIGDISEFYCALDVIRKHPSTEYWPTLIQIFDESLMKLNAIATKYPEDRRSYEMLEINNTFSRLFGALVAFKDEESLKYLKQILAIEHDWTVPAWKNFQKREMKWLAAALSGISDPQCFYKELMQIVAVHGAITLTLMKRILAHDPSLGLAWFTDIVHPVVSFDSLHEENQSEEDSIDARIIWLVKALSENNAPGRVDALCYYALRAKPATCNAIDTALVQFKGDQRIVKTLCYQLKHTKYPEVTQEAVKALLYFEEPSVDQRVEKIINLRRKKEPNFDRQGDLMRLFEAKERDYLAAPATHDE